MKSDKVMANSYDDKLNLLSSIIFVLGEGKNPVFSTFSGHNLTCFKFSKKSTSDSSKSEVLFYFVRKMISMTLFFYQSLLYSSSLTGSHNSVLAFIFSRKNLFHVSNQAVVFAILFYLIQVLVGSLQCVFGRISRACHYCSKTD